MNTPLANPVKRFFSDYLPVQKGLAANTIAAYRDTLKLVLCYAADRRKKAVEELTVEDLDEPLVLAFLDHLETDRGCSARTRNARLAAIRAFFGFLARENPLLLPQCQAIRAIPLKRHEHKTMTYLEENETQAVLDAVAGTARTGVRDQALLLVLYNTGARVSEIVHLKVDDLRLDDVPQVRLLGKGRKEPQLPAVAGNGRSPARLSPRAYAPRPSLRAGLSQCQRLSPYALWDSTHPPQTRGASPRCMPLPHKQARQSAHPPAHHGDAPLAVRATRSTWSATGWGTRTSTPRTCTWRSTWR